MQITLCHCSILAALVALPIFGADGKPSAQQIFDKQLSTVEEEVIAVVQTMPADKFGFVPPKGAFTSVRTFGVQARHIGFCLSEVATALLGEPMPLHTDQEGPRNLTSKEDVVKYLKDEFAQAHRAIGTLTNDNLLEQIRDPYVERLSISRVEAATIFLSHSWDHYGQMVEYLRMNNLTPPGHR